MKNTWDASSSVGFEEMANFYRAATKRQLQQMAVAFRDSDWNSFEQLIRKAMASSEPKNSKLPRPTHDQLDQLQR